MKATEKRTQIYLTAAQHRAAMALARRRGGSLAGVVRHALDRYLADAVHDDEATWEGDPAYALIGKIPLPDWPVQTSLAEDIDQMVYEEGPEPWSSPTAPASSPRSTHATPRTAKSPRRGSKSPKRTNA